jgi:hypothetical protein
MPSPGQVVQVVCDYYKIANHDVIKTCHAVRGPKTRPDSRRAKMELGPPASKIERWYYDMAREMIVYLCVEYGHSLRFIAHFVSRSPAMVGRIDARARLLMDQVRCLEVGGDPGSASQRTRQAEELRRLCDATNKTIG